MTPTKAIADPDTLATQSSASVHPASRVTRWRSGLIEGVTVGTTSYLRLDDEAEVRVERGRIRHGKGYGDARRQTRHLLARAGATLRLRERARYYVHGAASVGPLGRAWLLVGESGSGKSTLAYALARAGWPILGDDGVVLEQMGVQIVAHCWRQPVRVSAELAEWFSELRSHRAEADPTDPRRRIPVDVRHARRAPVGGLVVLRHGERDVLHAISRTDALAAMVRQSALVMLGDEYAVRHLELLRALVESVPCYGLEHTADQLPRIADTLREAGA